MNSTIFVTEQILLLFLGYVSLSKNEGESFAVSFSLCFLLQESHPDCDFEGGGGRGCFFLIFRVITHLTLERYRTLVVSRCVFNLSSAKVQHCHCGSRIFCQLFLFFFSTEPFSPVKRFSTKLRIVVKLSTEIRKRLHFVAVLQFSRSLSHTQKIVLYLYIYI